MTNSDEYSVYDYGVNQFLNRIGKDNPRYFEILASKQQLSENILRTRKYGDTPDYSVARSNIIYNLNQLALAELKMTFSELCSLSPSVTDAEIAHYRKLIETHQRRLYILEQQSAQYGLLAPPHIVIEIEEIKKQISELEIKIKAAQISPEVQAIDVSSLAINKTDVKQLRRLRVFLCHSSSDKPIVRELYQRLVNDGIDPWLDEEDILPGQDWEREIPKAVSTVDVVLVCLSRGSVTKTGYVQKEIRFALDIADEQPEGVIFIIPLKLEVCDVPQRLRRWQWVDFAEDKEKGYKRLLSALEIRASELGLTISPL